MATLQTRATVSWDTVSMSCPEPSNAPLSTEWAWGSVCTRMPLAVSQSLAELPPVVSSCFPSGEFHLNTPAQFARYVVLAGRSGSHL